MADLNDTPPTVNEDTDAPISDDAKATHNVDDTQETLKTDEEKADKYENEEFESDNESEAPRTDEEKANDNAEQPAEAKTDDEKLGDDSESTEKVDEETNNDNDCTDAGLENKGMENQPETPEVVETKEEESEKPAEKNDIETPTAQDEAINDAENTEVDNTETKDDGVGGEEVEQTPAESPEKIEENEEESTEQKAQEPVVAGEALDKEELEAKIRENEALALKLESALSNQEAESDAYKKLTEENAKLQKHHDDMKEKFDDMEGTHVVLVAEVETFRKVNKEQEEKIVRLEADIKLLKETEGGDENIRDMQAKLIRLSDEQEEKDKRIHAMEGELDAMRVKLQDAESRAAKSGNGKNTAQSSKTCVLM